MANAKFIDATTWGNLTEIDVTDGENLFPQLPAGTYRPVLSGVDSVTVPALSAGTIDQATPSEGDTLTVSGSNATGSATYQWQKDGVDISGATSASLDTTGEGAGDFRRGVSDGVQGPVYTSAVTVSASSGVSFSDDFSNYSNGYVITDSADYDELGSSGAGAELEISGGDLICPIWPGEFQSITYATTVGADQYVEAKIGAAAQASTHYWWRPIFRAVDGNNFGSVQIENGLLRRVRKRISGADSTVGATINETVTTGDVVRAEVDVATGDVRVYKNGSLLATVNDTVFATGGTLASGQPGLEIFNGPSSDDTGSQIAEFGCGEL